MDDSPKKIYWEFESDGCSRLKLAGSLNEVSLVFHLGNEYDLHNGHVPLTADQIVAGVLRLEAVLRETVALNERRKETLSDGPQSR